MNNRFITVFVWFLSVLTASVFGKDVLGCGGFLKSHVQIDFSSVEVKLLTKQGVLKDKTNCAPNNGYYFVPLYEKGDYILELKPPPGWSFTPTRVALTVDGEESDLCSQGKDINFVFNGFGITGKVESLGSDDGPAGVEIILLSSRGERATTLTDIGGGFLFTPVYPGKYSVTVSSTTKWKLLKSSVDVTVTEGNTNLPTNSLIIRGYNVTGLIRNQGEAVAGMTVVLLSKSKNNDIIKIDNCLTVDKSDLIDSKQFGNHQQILCHVKSNDKGVYEFHTVPYGDYYLSPYVKDRNRIVLKPDTIPFTVTHNNVKLSDNFEIIGLSVSGRILKYPGGNPVNAKIFLNNIEVAQTNLDGVYKLERIQSGTYNVKAEADGLLFKEATFKITPYIDNLPDLYPIAYRVCGLIVGSKSESVVFTDGGDTATGKQEQQQVVGRVESDSNTGKFCEFFHPGTYQVQVIVKNDDIAKGLQYFPKIQTVEVVNREINDIVFSQLKATVSGKLECIRSKDCVGLQAILKPLGGDLSSDENQLAVDIVGDTYTVSDVYPGTYDIKLLDNKLCWYTTQQTINVNSTSVEGPIFKQNGYKINFISSHDDTTVSYKLPDDKIRTIDIKKGRSAFCLERSGSYKFELNGCHQYDSNTISYNIDSESNELFLTSQKHLNKLSINYNNKDDDIFAKITIIDNVYKLIGPLDKSIINNNNINYNIELMLRPDELVTITPFSDSLVFKPATLTITGYTDCIDLGSKFKAELGLVFKGRVIPALAGVIVTIESDDNNNDNAIQQQRTIETDQTGTYQFLPLVKSHHYRIHARKDSYVFTGPDDKGDFYAHKLAEIVIEVVDEIDRKPLKDVLISLSGGESYRSNLQTDDTGKITFHSLSPNEYFLRAMMKEYNFEPQSKIIDVKEGKTVKVQLIGKRVAYSAYGYVSSLNGQPEDNVVVMALGTMNCSDFLEESTCDGNGQFRIRGLQPYCSYNIQVKKNNLIERSAPSIIHVKTVTTQDITDLKITVFRPVVRMDVLVKVYTSNPDYYKSLRLKVYRESDESSSSTILMHTTKIDTTIINRDYNTGILVQLPSLQIDSTPKSYSIQLESTLQKQLSSGSLARVFVANSSFKYIEFDFVVENSYLTEDDIKQTSVWTIVAIFVCLAIVYNVDRNFVWCQKVFWSYSMHLSSIISQNFGGKKTNGQDYHHTFLDNDDIDQIVQSINPTKQRKVKAKKI